MPVGGIVVPVNNNIVQTHRPQNSILSLGGSEFSDLHSKEAWYRHSWPDFPTSSESSEATRWLVHHQRNQGFVGPICPFVEVAIGRLSQLWGSKHKPGPPLRRTDSIVYGPGIVDSWPIPTAGSIGQLCEEIEEMQRQKFWWRMINFWNRIRKSLFLSLFIYIYIYLYAWPNLYYIIKYMIYIFVFHYSKSYRKLL